MAYSAAQARSFSIRRERVLFPHAFGFGSFLLTHRGPGPTGRPEVLSGIREWPPTPFVRAPQSAGHVAPCITTCCNGRVTEAAQAGFRIRQVCLSPHLPRAAEHAR